MGQQQRLGRAGEDAAAAYLRRRGMRPVARNWRCRYGEIDLVAREGGCLVFIEVKTRTSGQFGGPMAAVTPSKLARLRRLAAYWLQEAGGHRGPVRLDVVGLVRCGDGTFLIEHVRGVG